jgi:hypothetical protein
LLFGNKISYIHNLPNILHEIIIIIIKWKFIRIQGKDIHVNFSTLLLGWHNLFTWHISKKNSIVVDISHKATLDEETTLYNQASGIQCSITHWVIHWYNVTWNERNWGWLTKHSPSNFEHMRKYSTREQRRMPNLTHMYTFHVN